MENRMKRNISVRVWIVASASLAVALLVGFSSAMGVYLGNQFAQDRMLQNLPPIELKAGTAARTKSMSLATGLVDNNAEALFVLDHVSGNLQCWLLNSRTGAVGAIYTANVASDLMTAGKTGEPDYVMTTGDFYFTGNTTGNLAPGKSVCYVADATSGNVVGYGIVYNKQAVVRGAVQAGTLNVVCKGSARGEMTNRDQ
jgi:hypothetical protein